MSSKMTVYNTRAVALCEGVGWDSDLMESVRTWYMGHGVTPLRSPTQLAGPNRIRDALFTVTYKL